MPTIYERLKSDHDRHREWLAKLAGTEGASDARRKLWNTFYYDVAAHAAAEEVTFYSSLISESDGQSEARHSVAEHHELDEMMKELNEMDMSSPGWLTRFKTMKDRYEHHIDEEEEDIFPVAREVIGPDKSGQVAAEFAERKREEEKLVDKKADEALED